MLRLHARRPAPAPPPTETTNPPADTHGGDVAAAVKQPYNSTITTTQTTTAIRYQGMFGIWLRKLLFLRSQAWSAIILAVIIRIQNCQTLMGHGIYQSRLDFLPMPNLLLLIPEYLFAKRTPIPRIDGYRHIVPFCNCPYFFERIGPFLQPIFSLCFIEVL